MLKTGSPSERRVVMAKNVAQKWIEKHSHSEYRLIVFYGSNNRIKNLPGLLKSFRDGKIRIGSVEPLRDLGIEEAFDQITIWSSNKVGIMALNKWFENRDIETSGIW